MNRLHKTILRKPAGLCLFGLIARLFFMGQIADICAQSSGTVYFVHPQGSDSAKGITPETAWRTVKRVNRAAFNPGDRILFFGGTEFAGNLYFDAEDAGTTAAPVLIGSFGKGRATLNAGAGSGVEIDNAGGFEIESLCIVGNDLKTNQSHGIYVHTNLPDNIKLEHVHIRNLEITGFGKTGITIESQQQKSGYRDIHISHSHIHHNAVAGISTLGVFDSTATQWAHEDVYVGYCRVYHHPGISGSENHSGNGIVLADVNRAVIEYCEAFENGECCDFPNGGPVGIWAWDANAVTIQFNESHHNRTTAASWDGGGFDLDGGVTNSVMQYNYAHDNDGAGFFLAQFWGARPFHSNIVRYNISQNDGRRHDYGGLTVWSAIPAKIHNIAFYNNTVYMGPADDGTPSAVQIKTSGRNLHFFNNLFIADGVPLVRSVDDPGAMFLGNAYSPGKTSFRIIWGSRIFADLLTWRNATGQERYHEIDYGLSGNPLVMDSGKAGTIGFLQPLSQLRAYRLLENSPLIDTGLDLSELFDLPLSPHDFFGTPVIQDCQYDIGANEFRQGQ